MGSKCDQCERGDHFECKRPGEEVTELDGSTFDLCCCNTLGLWYDEHGIERWPGGMPYSDDPGLIIIDDLPPSGPLTQAWRDAMIAWARERDPKLGTRTSWVRDDLITRIQRGDHG